MATPKMQGFGDAKDMRHCVEYLRDKNPAAKLVSVGSSAGSGLLASYLGEYGADCHLATGVAVCPAYKTVEFFTKPLNVIYQFLLLSSVKKILKKHAKVLSPLLDLNAAYNSKCFMDYDTHVYCKFYGYKDVFEYWKHNNPLRNYQNISVPIMCISSLDDPISLGRNIPFHLFRENSNWLLATTSKGGHCGFLEDATLTSWADRLALDYIDAVLEFQTADNKP